MLALEIMNRCSWLVASGCPAAPSSPKTTVGIRTVLLVFCLVIALLLLCCLCGKERGFSALVASTQVGFHVCARASKYTEDYYLCYSANKCPMRRSIQRHSAHGAGALGADTSWWRVYNFHLRTRRTLGCGCLRKPINMGSQFQMVYAI